MNADSLWGKVDLSVRTPREQAAEASHGEEVVRKPRGWSKWQVRLLDGTCVFLWGYVFVKLFVFDIDSYLVARFTPSATHILDYRFFLIGAIFVTLVLFSRGRRIKYIYVALFPLVVILWKIPRWVYRIKSWIVVLALLNVATSAVMHFKFNVVTRFCALLALLGVSVSENRIVLGIAAAYLGVYFVTLMARTIWFSVKPSQFLKAQQSLVEIVSGGTFAVNLTTVSAELRDSDLEKFSSAQLATFQSNLSMAVLVNRAVYYWAYQLEKYRTSAAALSISAIAYASLYVQGIIVFTAVNYTILKMDPSAFSYSGDPSLVQVAYYSLFYGAGSALTPVSGIAIFVKIATNVIAPLFLTALVTQFLINRRQVEQETATQEIVAKIKATGAGLEEKLQKEYEVSVEEAIERLQELGENFFMVAITAISAKLPPGYESE